MSATTRFGIALTICVLTIVSGLLVTEPEARVLLHGAALMIFLPLAVVNLLDVFREKNRQHTNQKNPITMKKPEIKSKVSQLLSSGTAKAEVFAQLSGQGVKDSQLAHWIASYPDPLRCELHSGKVNALITLMFISAAIGFLLGYGIGREIGPNAKWVVAALAALIPLLFAWGFYSNRVGAYNGYILLAIVQLPRSFDGFMSSPVASSIGIAITIGLTAYVWYVRDKVFPGFLFLAPKKVKGKYVFGG